MTAAAPTIQTLLERLEETERRNRSLQRVGAAGLIVGGTAALLAIAALLPRLHPGEHGQRNIEKVVEAERFVVRDATGAVRAELAVEGRGAASLSLFDRDGEHRVRLRPSGLYLSDSGGTQRAALHLTPGALASDPSAAVLRLADAGGKPRGSLMVLADGSSRLLLSDRDGSGGASLQADAHGPAGLALSDSNGRNAAWLGALPDGSRALVMADQANKATAMISIAADGATEVLLADRTGRERAALAVLPDGTPFFKLSGKDAQGGATLGVTPSGTSVLDLVDRGGKAGTMLMAANDSSGLLIRDNSGKEIAGLSTEAGRWPRLALSGDGVSVGALLTVSPGGAPGLALYDTRGKPRAVLGQVSVGKTAGTTPHAGDRVPFALTFVDRDGKIDRRVSR